MTNCSITIFTVHMPWCWGLQCGRASCARAHCASYSLDVLYLSYIMLCTLDNPALRKIIRTIVLQLWHTRVNSSYIRTQVFSVFEVLAHAVESCGRPKCGLRQFL